MMKITFLCFFLTCCIYIYVYIYICIYISVANKWKTGKAPPILGIQNSLSPGQKGDEGSGPGSQENFLRPLLFLLFLETFHEVGPSKRSYPLVNIQKAIENGPVEIVDFPIHSMVDLSSSLCKRSPGRVVLKHVKAHPCPLPPLSALQVAVRNLGCGQVVRMLKWFTLGEQNCCPVELGAGCPRRHIKNLGEIWENRDSKSSLWFT